MGSLASKLAITTVAVIAILYQFIFKSLIFDTLGYGRAVSPISAFQARCEKVDGLGLEGCEDMWIHEPTGFLYMACSDSQSRTQWLPAIDHLNASARGLNDRMAVLDTRGSGPVASRLQWLSTENFSGINGDATLNLHGFDVWADKNTDTLRILLINHRPPLDPLSGSPLDATLVGANSTVELFQTKAGSSKMRHVRTYVHELIETPNRVAWVNDHAFVYTNDRSGKTGMRRQADILLGGGTVGYCSRNRCNIAKSSGFNMPNGLARGRDGLIYVPNTYTGEIQVFSLTEGNLLKKVNTIKLPYPLDNLSVDKDDDIYAAAFPQVYKWSKGSKMPFDIYPPSTIFRIRKESAGSYSFQKVLEDDGSILPGSTVAVHDWETGRIFMGGAVSPYITICETR